MAGPSSGFNGGPSTRGNRPGPSRRRGIGAPVIPALFKYRGMNFPGFEYGKPSVNLPDVSDGWNRPTDASISYYKSRGINLIRLPYKGERVQPDGPGAALGTDANSAAYIAALSEYATRLRAAGMIVCWDLHNYAQWSLKAENFATPYYVGSTQFPVSALADFHVKFAQYPGLVKPEDHIDLMNEPTQSIAVQGSAAVDLHVQWVNACLSALRSAGVTNLVHVPGMAYSQASGYVYHGTDKMAARVVDPGNNWILHLHQYVDSNQSGSQDNTLYGLWPSKLLRSVREWAKRSGIPLFLGELNATYSTNSTQATVNAGRNALHEYFFEMGAYPEVWHGFAGWRGGGRIDGNDITSMDEWTGGFTSPNSDIGPTPTTVLDGRERDKLTILKRYTGPRVSDILGSKVDYDFARGASKGGPLASVLAVTRGARPSLDESGRNLPFGPNVARITNRGVEVSPPVVNDNLITTQDVTGAGWTLGNPGGNRLTVSKYVDPDDGQTYTRLQMTGNYDTSIRFILAYSGNGRMSAEFKTLGTANQYVGFYGGGGAFGDKDINIDGSNSLYPKGKWFRADWGANANWGFHLLNRSVQTDILIRNIKFNLGSTATPYVEASYDGDLVSIVGPLLGAIQVPDFTLCLQTRALSASAVVVPLLGGIVGGGTVPLLQRTANGGVSTGLGGTLATGALSLDRWADNPQIGEWASRRVALAVRRSGTPRVVIGATGLAAVGANQLAGDVASVTLGSIGGAYAQGVFERAAVFDFMDTAGLEALVA